MGWDLHVEGEIKLPAPIEAPEHRGRYITLRRNAEGKVVALAPSQEDVWVKTGHYLPVEELVEITALLPAGVEGRGHIEFEYEGEPGAEYQPAVRATHARPGSGGGDVPVAAWTRPGGAPAAPRRTFAVPCGQPRTRAFRSAREQPEQAPEDLG